MQLFFFFILSYTSKSIYVAIIRTHMDFQLQEFFFFFTCVFGVCLAGTVAPTIVIAWCHNHTVGTVAGEVREGTHWCRVVTQDDF